MSWFVYILECADQSLYTGITNDLDSRIKDHNDGLGAKYTRSFAPVKLIWKEEHADASSAAKREAQIKRWTRKKKLALVAGNFKLLKSL